jgi:hypothetical protein
VKVNKRDILNLISEVLLAAERSESKTQERGEPSPLVCEISEILFRDFPQFNIEKWEINNLFS